jgi:hypothetical protein
VEKISELLIRKKIENKMLAKIHGHIPHGCSMLVGYSYHTFSISSIKVDILKKVNQIVLSYPLQNSSSCWKMILQIRSLVDFFLPHSTED